MQNIPKKINNIIEEFIAGVNKILGKRAKKIILYGSYARGDFNKKSDVDIMIFAVTNKFNFVSNAVDCINHNVKGLFFKDFLQTFLFHSFANCVDFCSRIDCQNHVFQNINFVFSDSVLPSNHLSVAV